MTQANPRAKASRPGALVRIGQALRNRPRLLVAAAIGIAAGVCLPASLAGSTRLLIGWDAGSLTYLLACGRMMLQSDLGDMRERAYAQDEGRLAILVLTGLGIAVSFGAIAAELHGLGDGAGAGAGTGWRVALAAVTILLSWTLTQVVMALHYAGEYYDDPTAEGGLDFPGGDREPDYMDFLYFAFTMGAACQTSDVSVTERGMRALVLAHTILAFLFNTTILALAVNVGASVL